MGAKPSPFSSARLLYRARPVTDAPWVSAADARQVERNPMCLCLCRHCSRVAAPPFLEVGASGRLGARGDGTGCMVGPSLLSSSRGSSPLPLAERRGQQLGTAGAPGRLAHMVVSLAWELPAGSPSRASSHDPHHSCPCPCQLCHTLYPTQLLSVRCSVQPGHWLGAQSSVFYAFFPWGAPRASWGSLGARRSRTKAEPSR